MHKKIDEKADKEFEAKVKELSLAFIRFQIDHDCRAVITNEYQDNPQYPPNILVDLVSVANRLSWRRMDAKEKADLQTKLVEQSGIVLPK